MSGFNSSRSALATALTRIRSDAHSFVVVDMPKGSRNGTVDKRKLLREVETAINEVDTDDFRIAVVVAKVTK